MIAIWILLIILIAGISGEIFLIAVYYKSTIRSFLETHHPDWEIESICWNVLESGFWAGGQIYEIMKSQRAGEPADLFNIEIGKIEEFLSQRGLRMLEHLNAADMERKYLTLRDGSPAGKMTGHVCFANAVVAG